jgi:CheY-like chemotaxis protein
MPNSGLQQDLLSVLLIDDDLVSREVMATVLTMSGYAVHTAANGEASLEVLAEGGCVPAVILMDAQMPGLSGERLIEKLRALCKANIYVISASTAPDEMVKAADGFVLKPLTSDCLQKIIGAHKPQPARAAPSSLDALDQQAEDPVVNPKILAQLREMMPAAAVRQIYTAVVADLEKRIAALEAAIAHGDAAEVRRLGHALKGGCSMAGAVQAARLGASIESGVLESNGNLLGNNSSVLGELRTAARRLESMLKAEFPA